MATPSTSPPDQVKVVVTLSGDVISHADINLKLPRPGGMENIQIYHLFFILTICKILISRNFIGGKDLYANTSIHDYAPWQLQQVQDSVNHLSSALALIRTSKAEYKSATELTHFLTRIMTSLTRSRNSLVNPKKRTLEELRNSKQVVKFHLMMISV